MLMSMQTDWRYYTPSRRLTPVALSLTPNCLNKRFKNARTHPAGFVKGNGAFAEFWKNCSVGPFHFAKPTCDHERVLFRKRTTGSYFAQTRIKRGGHIIAEGLVYVLQKMFCKKREFIRVCIY